MTTGLAACFNVANLGGSLQVGQAARSLVELVSVEPSGAAAAWESRHKQQIRGSAAVLAHLQTRPPYLQQLFSNPHRCVSRT